MLVIDELLIENTNERVLVCQHIPSDFVLCVAKFLDDCLHDLFIKSVLFLRVLLEVRLEKLLAVFKPIVDFRLHWCRHELLIS